MPAILEIFHPRNKPAILYDTVMYHLTGMECLAAASHTALNLSTLSSMEQLMFFWENVSDAAPKMATSLAPADTW